MRIFAVVVLLSIYFMFVTTRTELAPTEDQSILFFQAVAPQTATVEYDKVYADQIIKFRPPDLRDYRPGI
jgi:multidrug efflux pump